ncbi:hypothetical protein RB195_014958 [Necator americanus]|uniref:Uncharacterized protein n=1 Tax=Necator americanus TaxID=51031 RepID=A0ABR1E2H5_NECAM
MTCEMRTKTGALWVWKIRVERVKWLVEKTGPRFGGSAINDAEDAAEASDRYRRAADLGVQLTAVPLQRTAVEHPSDEHGYLVVPGPPTIALCH